MSIVLTWCAGFTVYLLFAGQISWHEVATGIVLASLSTAWARIIRRTSQRHFRFSSNLLRPLGRGLAQLFPATFATGAVLARVAALGGRTGHCRANYFEYGEREDSTSGLRGAISGLVASAGRHKIGIGLVLVGLTTALTWTIRRMPRRVLTSVRLPGWLTRAVSRALPQLLAFGAALLRVWETVRPAGRSERDHLDNGVAKQSVDRTRRAFAVLLASCTPDRFVVNLDRRSQTALVHVIVPDERELDPLWLI